MSLRDEFEKLFPVPECAYWCEQVALYGLKVPADVGTDTWIACYGYNDRWRGFQSGMAAGMERAAEEADNYESSFGSMGSSSAARALRSLAAAIRAMKEQKK